MIERLRRAIAVVAIIIGAAGAFSAEGQKKKASKEDTFLSGPPFTLNDIVTRVGIIADHRLSAAVSRRGIAFTPTQADYDRLKSVGASQELIAAVTAKAPPPPKAPPKPEVAGPVELECAPAECDIAVNGQSRGSTHDGKIELAGLPPGNVFVDFRRDGYVGQQVTLALEAGKGDSRSVKLEPTNATKQALGRQLFSAMASKLGGPDALRKSTLVEAEGSAILFSSGQRTEWNVTARLKLPLLASVEINGAGLKWRTSIKGSESKSDGAGKLKGSAVALDMEKLVRLYRDYQPAALVQRLNEMRLFAPSLTPNEAGRVIFHAATDTESWRVALTQDATPVIVIYTSASGLGSGLEVVYSEYAAVSNVWYPKSMAIKFSDQAQHGMELHFADVHFPANLPDKEFHY